LVGAMPKRLNRSSPSLSNATRINNMETRVVAKVALVSPDNSILLLRRSETDVRRPNEFDIPGGHTDDGEFAEEAAARETFEEAGIDIDAKDLKLVYSETKVVDESLNVVWLFFVGHTAITDVKLSSEHSEFCWAPLEEAIDILEYDRQKRMLSHIRDNQLI
jgi:8-oxo-dGTP pyrophosphatase MutT (NUDIX family)